VVSSYLRERHQREVGLHKVRILRNMRKSDKARGSSMQRRDDLYLADILEEVMSSDDQQVSRMLTTDEIRSIRICERLS
jgi:hypothetical protein